MLTVDFDRLPLKAGSWVLDLGCGEGRHAISLECFSEVNAVGVDLSRKDLLTANSRRDDLILDKSGTANRRFWLAQTDALRLPFADNSFDVVICSEVLEHIQDYHRVIVEIERILKPGGEFAVSVPRFGPEWICWQLSEKYHLVEGGHIRIFKARQLKETIASSGFEFLHRHWAHGLHSPFWWLKCLFWDTQDSSWLVKKYHQFLVWDLMSKPVFTRLLEKILNPFIGKSVVMYFRQKKAVKDTVASTDNKSLAKKRELSV